nr:ribonuclease H-like domain-containing protein [Tanacetum cinerariifolium]
MVSTVKLLILKKGEYILWTMKMEQYLAYTDYALWEVILNGNSIVQMTKDEAGNEIKVTPVTTQQILARTIERKAKRTLIMAIPDEYLTRFYGIKDAKTLWVAIKIRFGEITNNTNELNAAYSVSTATCHSSQAQEDDTLPRAADQPRIQGTGVEMLGMQDTEKEIMIKGLQKRRMNKHCLHIKEEEVTKIVFDNRSSDKENSIANDRFKKGEGYHAVPPLTGNYMPPKPDLSFAGLDDSIYKFKIKKPKEDRSSALLIDDRETDSDNDSVFTPEPIPAKIDFMKAGVFTRSGRIPVSAAKPKAATSTSAAKPVNTTGPKQSVNFSRTRSTFNKSHSPIKRSFYNATAHSRRNTTERVNTIGSKAVSAVKGNALLLLRPQQGHPQHALKNKEVVNSGCSRCMTGNKTYLADYQEIQDGGFVAFGSSRGKITGKGKIKIEKLEFDVVYFVNELKFNLFSVSQMCDKKNSVLFTETECLVLSPKFKLLDGSQVLLRVPRQKNMYSFDLQNVFPSRNLTCLFAKASIDESNLWYRRLGHVNFKTMNKLMKENLIRGLPSKIFNNDHSYVACQKGKQHKATYKAKLAEAVNTTCYVLNRASVTKTHNKTPYELLSDRSPRLDSMRLFGYPVTILNTLDPLGKFEGKANEGFLVGYFVTSKDFRVFNTKTKKVKGNLHVRFLKSKPNVARTGTNWLFDIDSLTNSMNYIPVSAENQTDKNAGPQDTNGNAGTQDNVDAGKEVSDQHYIVLSLWSSISSTYKTSDDKPIDDKPKDDTGSKTVEESVNKEDQAYRDELDRLMSQEKEASDAADALRNNPVNDASTSRTFSAGGPSSPHPDAFIPTKTLLHLIKVWRLVDLPYEKKAIGTRWVYRNKKDERGIVVRNKARLVAQGHGQGEGIDYDDVFAHVARIEAIKIILAFASFMRFIVYQMDVKSALLYGIIKEEVYVSQPIGFIDPQFINMVYKVEKALYGLHQAPRAWLQVKQSEEGIFISQDKDSEAIVKDEVAADVTPKLSHLQAMKRIFRYLKGQPKLGLWYPRDFPFDLEAYSDSNYAGANLDRKSTTGEYDTAAYYCRQTKENAEFHQIVDFLSTCSINYALTVSPTIYASYIEQFRNTTISKPVNSVKQIHAIVNGKAMVISESSVRIDLLFNDEDGKVTPLFDSMLVHKQVPEGEGSTIPTKPQLTLSTSQPNISATQTATHPTVSHKLQTEAYIEQILSSASTYQRKHKKTHKPRKAKKVSELPQTSVPLDIGADEAVHREGVTAPRNHIGGVDAQIRFETASKRSSDPLLLIGHTVGSGEDMMVQETNLTDFVPSTPHDSPLSGGHTPGSDEGRPNLLELMNICTKLSNMVLVLEEAKTTQDKVITRLKLRVRRLEKKRKARTSQPIKRRLFKGRVETSTDKSLCEDASKQGSNDDQIEELNLTNRADTKVIVKDKGSGKKGSSTADQVSTARPEVSATTPSTPLTTTTIFVDEDLTIDQTLIKMRSKKAKEKGVAFRDTKVKVYWWKKTQKVKRKDQGLAQIESDADLAQRIYEEELAELDRAQKERQKQKEATIAALTEEFDEIQARMDADHELAVE